MAVYFLGQLIVDRGFALVGAPILSGGVVATLQMTEMANNASRPELAVFATLVMCAQGFVGYPVASLCLKSEAKRLKRDIDAGSVSLAPVNAAQTAARKKLIPALPAKYNTPNTIIAKVILVALLSTWVSSLFHDAVNKLVWCLIFGVLLKELGFLDEDALGKANATGIVMPIITLSIFTNLASATPEMVGSMVVPLLVCVVIGTIAFSLASILVGKLFGYSWQMSMAIGAPACSASPEPSSSPTRCPRAPAPPRRKRPISAHRSCPRCWWPVWSPCPSPPCWWRASCASGCKRSPLKGVFLSCPRSKLTSRAFSMNWWLSAGISTPTPRWV